jgi:lysophospholipase L1-like esterase
MKILVFGHSGTLGYGAPQGERFPVMLKEILEARFPEDSIDVSALGWGYFTRQRSRELVAVLEQTAPDYLLMATTPVWVYFPSWAFAARRRLPARLQHLVGRIAQTDAKMRERLLRWPWLLRLYGWPLHLLAELLVGAQPLYTIQEVVDFLETLIVAGKRREAMQMMVLGAPTIARAVAERYPAATAQSNEFIAALAALCRRHHAEFVDIHPASEGLPWQDLYLPDNLHFLPIVKRKEAEVVARAIARYEEAYHQPMAPHLVGLAERGAGVRQPARR